MISELSKYPIEAPKGGDLIITREFLVTLFRLLYTYQTIGREAMKEEILEKRIKYIKEGEIDKYKALLDNRTKEFSGIQMEMKDIVFDYFNIITKEYELAYEKWKEDPTYVEEITKIK